MAVNVYPVTFDFVLPPPPSTFSGNLAQVFELIQQTLQGSLAQDAAVLGQGTVLPTSDLGPFIYTGYDPPQLYTWSTSQSKYVPSALPPTALTNYLTISAFNAAFAGFVAGKQQMDWSNVVNKPPMFADVMVGNTAARPASPAQYQQYYDTDLNCQIVYVGSGWRTIDGCSGDVKFVKAGTLLLALSNNPGWTQNTDATDRVLISAGNLYGENTSGGNASVTLSQTQLPASLSNLTLGNLLSNGIGGANPVIVNTTAAGFSATTVGPGPTITNPGGGQPVSILNPYIAYWCLIKT